MLCFLLKISAVRADPVGGRADLDDPICSAFETAGLSSSCDASLCHGRRCENGGPRERNSCVRL